MCEYCTRHGSGKRWYENARNFSKELASTDYVIDFNDRYFVREPKPGSRVILEYDSTRPIDVEERSKVDTYYKKYLHHQVVTHDEATSVLRLAGNLTEDHEKTIVALPCICRYAVYGKDKSNACFGIAFSHEYTKRFPDYLGGNHQYLSVDEAQEHLENLITNEDLVHAVSALGVPYIGMLCNCDMKVCSPYYQRVRLGIDSPFHKGHSAAFIDASKCTQCGTCQEVCSFNVPIISDDESIMTINPESCFGCGVCVKHCPEDAIVLEPFERKLGF
ncbi:4Fe-4S dicluster domain-containing protein [Candidatus Thorarchaeota archaeon]|nr:MAG: 4Fe-4S dicluster domain-containing protein [Candidatus Thorarchaeota archaeon]